MIIVETEWRTTGQKRQFNGEEMLGVVRLIVTRVFQACLCLKVFWEERKQ